jgi:hypothetical protein
MSDDEEDEYNTIAQAASNRGVKLLFSKSKVRQFPSKRKTKLTRKSRSTFIQLPPLKIISLALSPSSNKNLSPHHMHLRLNTKTPIHPPISSHGSRNHPLEKPMIHM